MSRWIFLAGIVLPAIGLGRLLWAATQSTARGLPETSFVLPSEPQPRTPSGAIRCSRIAQETAFRRLPKGGALYRLGHVPANENNESGTSRQFLVLSGGGNATTWDMLWNDYSGAFDQRKAANVTHQFIPWRTPHAPLFFVVYSSEPVDVNVVRAGESSPASLPGGSSSCPQHLKTATRVVAGGDNVGAQSDVSVEVVNTEEAFRYPVRKPFFRRRSSQSGLVTVCTQLTVDRLPRLKDMASAFAGPISAAVYVGYRDDASSEVAKITEFYASSDVMQEYVDLHLVFDDKKPWYATGTGKGPPKPTPGAKTPRISMARPSPNGVNPYPVNLLRQYSIDQATTDWVLYLEGDMSIVPKAHGIIANTWDGMMQFHKQSNGTAVFVVPIYSPNGTKASIPSSKTELMSAGTFMRMRYASHQALNYDAWESGVEGGYIPYHESGDPKAIMLHRQEPYFIVRRQDMPPYNVLFNGMTQDKETHVRDTNACGFRFFVHPDLFAVDFPSSAESGWTSILHRTWRQSFAHAIHEAYKQEAQKAAVTAGGTAFMCGDEGLREISARGWMNDETIPPYEGEIRTEIPKRPGTVVGKMSVSRSSIIRDVSNAGQ